MSIKKRVVAVAAVIAMAALAMYGSTREMRSGEGLEERFALFGGDKETIYFWYSDESLTNYVNSAAVSFGEREGARVIPVLTSESEYLEAVYKASIAEEQMPDAYLLTNDLLGKAYLAGLASRIADESGVCSEENFPKAALSSVTYQDRYIAYPLSYETSILVYNKTYLEEWAAQQTKKALESEEELEEDGEASAEESGEEEQQDAPEDVLAGLSEEELLEYYRKAAIPQTVEDILNIANTFDVPEGVEGVMKWDVSDILYNYWFVGRYMVVGGDMGDDVSKVDIVNEETIQCLEAYKSMNQFFSIESDTITYDSVVDDFIDGRIVFTIATTDIVKRLEDAGEEGRFPYEYGLCILPDVSSELESRSMSVTNTVVVNGYSLHKELANRFAQYLTEECAPNLYARTGKVAAARHANEENELLGILMSEYADSVPLPKLMETENFWMHLEVLFSKIWNGEDVTAALQELDDQMNIQLGNVSE